MGGSILLAVGGAVLIAVLVARGSRLLEVERSKGLTAFTHGATLAFLVFAVATFPKSRVDAVLIVVMLGIFNRWVLRGGHRDDLIVLGASGVLTAAATTITPGIAFVPIIVGFMVSTLWALWAAMVLGTAEEKPAATRRAEIHRAGDRLERPPLGQMAAFGVLFAVIGSAVMMIFPRYHIGRIFSPGYFMALAGTSDSMELQTGGVPDVGGGAIVARIEATPGRPESAMEGAYLQIGVLDTFDGRTWRARIENPRRKHFLYAPGELYRGPRTELGSSVDGPNTVRVTLFRRARRSEDHPVAHFGTDGPGYVAMFGVRQLDNGGLVTHSFPGTQLVYKVDPDRRVDVLPLPDQAERFTDLPDGIDPRVVELARSLTAGEPTIGGKVRALLRHFSRGFTYSLDPLEGEADDPLVRFLFEAKSGHCELYAGALATLLRLSGVEARVAVGYYGGWWNSIGGYLELAEGDAHAWVEVYDDGRWRWVDATPSDLRRRRAHKTFAWIMDLYDAAEAWWHNRILAFDERERRELFGEMQARFRSIADVRGDATPVEAPPLLGGGGPLLPALGLVLAIAAAAALVLRSRSRRTDILGARLRAALGAKDRNATLGVLLSSVNAGVLEQAKTAIAAYERLRFGPPAEAPGAADVAARIRALERAAKGRIRPRRLKNDLVMSDSAGPDIRR
jgi:transglutaminase-like putative cysteine protease